MTIDPAHITIITGPTASGKTALAIKIAQEKNGVIINADAMQMYDALPVLTAQPDEEECAQAPHRLYGSCKSSNDMNAADWRDIAIEEIERALALGMHPILVGGTGFYIKALIQGLSPIPEITPTIRDTLNAKRNGMNMDDFFREFAHVDPVMAQRLRPTDAQRITRAWEVLLGTGKSLAHWQDMPLIPPPSHYHFHIIMMIPDRAALHERIERRIGFMLKQGALDEVEALMQAIDQGEVSEDALIVKAHGFRAFRRYLRGEWRLEEAKERTAAETRQYSKRQGTWMRSQYNLDKMAHVTKEEYSC